MMISDDWRPTALLIDLDGVVYQEGRVITDAMETLQWIRQRNIPYRFLTNTSSKSRGTIVEKLVNMGIRVDAGHILTPPVAARDWLRENVEGPVALFVNDATLEDFAGISPLESPDDEAAAVVLGDLGTGWSFERLNRAFRLLMGANRPPLLALGMTRFWQTEDGLQLDVGPFVRALEYASGSEAVVLGKPDAGFFHAALRALDCDAGDALMIGDDLTGDVHGAEAAGIQGALVKTGKFRPSDVEVESPPTVVLESLAQLPSWWEGRTENP